MVLQSPEYLFQLGYKINTYCLFLKQEKIFNKSEHRVQFQLWWCSVKIWHHKKEKVFFCSWFNETDKLKIPKISFNLKQEITEVENKPYTFSNGDIYYIEKALQTIEFDLDEKGGRIKSEAGMMTKLSAAMPEEPREFMVDDTFTIFLKEKGKDLPYFAAQISDISQVQEDIQ